ncbi:hypothetical protein NEHOM01_2446 [Nematocida homosporus]|uniref:uncharacterized protein n=1 Tax=Nematocida homosporus TaxID=1912981 RepID=UPI00221FD218|nr:uncharacterized protein NEHOM01_2446 [Nematocida homosporus]KAI5187921.1 hypothetical protein NEHOM01_2446 [Nematocida homosporus]
MKSLLVTLLLCLASVYGFIELYQAKAPIVVIKELKKSTVTLSEVKVYMRRGASDNWSEVNFKKGHGSSDSSRYTNDEDDVKVEMAIYESPTKDWHSLTTVSAKHYISKMSHSGSKMNFLWTSTNAGYYMFLFRLVSELEDDPNIEIGLDVVTYEGRPEDPSIYSHADSQIRNKDKRIRDCINISKEILQLQEKDRMDEMEYTQATNGIFRVIVWSVFLKIVVFITSFLWINRKIQNFYLEKKIVVKY